MARIRRMVPWLVAIFAVAVSLSLTSLLLARAGTEFTASSGVHGSFHAGTFSPPIPVLEPYPAAVIASGPVLYYRLNETSGTVAVDSAPGPGGVAVPAPGTRPGTFYGRPQLPQLFGNGGPPLGSNGASFAQPRVPAPVGGNPGSCVTSQVGTSGPGGAGSVPVTSTGTLEFLAKGGMLDQVTLGGMARFLQYLVLIRAQTLTLTVLIDANSIFDLNTPNGTLNFGYMTTFSNIAWVHYAFTWNSTGFSFYVNGNLIGTVATNVMSGRSELGLVVGGENCTNYGGGNVDFFANFFTGTLSNVAYYTRALSQAELSTHARAGGL